MCPIMFGELASLSAYKEQASPGIQGVGANSAMPAHRLEQVPRAELQPTMEAGAATAATVPNVKPAAT